MSHKLIDVHSFDGQLKNKYTSIKNYSIYEKHLMFNNIKEELKSPLSIQMLNIIVKDLLSGRKSDNYQIENDMDASDILADIIIYKDFKNILPILDEQLQDILMLGSCGSGRCTRLYQIWKSIYENQIINK